MKKNNKNFINSRRRRRPVDVDFLLIPFEKENAWAYRLWHANEIIKWYIFREYLHEKK